MTTKTKHSENPKLSKSSKGTLPEPDLKAERIQAAESTQTKAKDEPNERRRAA